MRQLGVAVDPLGQAEVGDVGLALLVEQDIGRLQVAVEDAALVGVMDRLGDDGDQPRRGAGVGGELGEPPVQAATRRSASC